MPETNPFAYTEESPLPRSFSQGNQEPHLPITLWLKHKTGVFSSKPCKMTVTENQVEINGEHLAGPIVIERNKANHGIKLRLLDMIVRDEYGRKFRMIYSKDDSDRFLALARLEAWLYPEDAEGEYDYVLKRLKHWTCALVKNWLLCLSVLQFLALIYFVIMFAVNPPDGAPAERVFIILFLLIWIGFLIATNLLWLTLLRSGRMGALYGVIGVYSLFCLMALATINVLGFIFGVVMIIMSFKASKDFNRLQNHIGGSFDM